MAHDLYPEHQQAGRVRERDERGSGLRRPPSRPGHGIATLVLGQLAELADAEGIATLTATVDPTNHRMLRVFRDSGFAMEVTSEPESCT
jgi:RimJ/RimL family protein N-acetyltransferase